MSTQTPDAVKQAIHAQMSKASRTRTTESRRAAARKAWQTRLANLAAKLARETEEK